MSVEDNFIARWSRLKRQAAESRKPEAGPSSRPSGEGRAEQPAAQPAVGSGEARAAAEPPFDETTLPPIDSIVAGSDIRAFLQKGVPAELTKAALRRAWSTDPAIRDFIGLAENQWDFTDPTAIPGFGPLEAADNVRQLVGQAMGKLAEVPPDAAGPADENRDAIAGAVAEEAAEVRQQGAPLPEESDNRDAVDVTAVQHPEPAHEGIAPRPRGHGGALPK